MSSFFFYSARDLPNSQIKRGMRQDDLRTMFPKQTCICRFGISVYVGTKD